MVFSLWHWCGGFVDGCKWVGMGVVGGYVFLTSTVGNTVPLNVISFGDVERGLRPDLEMVVLRPMVLAKACVDEEGLPDYGHRELMRVQGEMTAGRGCYWW